MILLDDPCVNLFLLRCLKMVSLDTLDVEIKRLCSLNLEDNNVDIEYFRDCVIDCLISIMYILKEIKNEQD